MLAEISRECLQMPMFHSLCRSIGVVCLLAMSGVTTFADETSADSPALAKGKTLFASVSKAARDKLMASFDQVLMDIPEAKGNEDDKARMLKAVTAEKARFEKENLAPWSAPMRTPYATYRKQFDSAAVAVRRAYDIDIKKAAREKDVSRVTALKNELDALLPDLPIAYWTHLAVNNPPVVIAMFADGSFTDRQAHRVCQYVVVKDKLLLKWPVGSPGQFVQDTCDIASEGLQYEGFNVAGDRISGSYHVVNP
jgi:hypothetical protein